MTTRNEGTDPMKLRCAAHGREFSEAFDRNFHEALNVGCRWEEVRESGRSGNRMWVAIVLGTAWLALTLILSLVHH